MVSNVPVAVALIFGVAVGLASSDLWLRARTLSYCTVADNAEWYHGRVVRVKAKVYFGSGGMRVYEDCDPTEALAASVEIEGPTRIAMRYVTGQEPQLKVADAIIEGEFDAHASPGCWSPKFHIAATRIQLISSVTDYVPPENYSLSRRVKH